MRVEHERSGNQPGQRGDRSQRAESETAGVVGIVYGVLTIDAGTGEVVEMLDEEDLGPGLGSCHPEDTGLLGVGSHWHSEGLTDRLEIGIDVADGAVKRKDSGHIQSGGLL